MDFVSGYTYVFVLAMIYRFLFSDRYEVVETMRRRPFHVAILIVTAPMWGRILGLW